MRKHRILVPVDGSDFSRQIFPDICDHFAPDENELTLLRVGQPPAGRVGMPARPTSPDSSVEMYASQHEFEQASHPIYASQERESALAEFQREMQSDVRVLEAAGYTVYMEIRFGNPAREIEDFVKLHDVDLVAMTTHGRSGLDRLLFGSVAEHLVRHVSVPIMIMRPSRQRAA